MCKRGWWGKCFTRRKMGQRLHRVHVWRLISITSGSQTIRRISYADQGMWRCCFHVKQDAGEPPHTESQTTCVHGIRTRPSRTHQVIHTFHAQLNLPSVTADQQWLGITHHCNVWNNTRKRKAQHIRYAPQPCYLIHGAEQIAREEIEGEPERLHRVVSSLQIKKKRKKLCITVLARHRGLTWTRPSVGEIQKIQVSWLVPWALLVHNVATILPIILDMKCRTLRKLSLNTAPLEQCPGEGSKTRAPGTSNTSTVPCLSGGKTTETSFMFFCFCFFFLRYFQQQYGKPHAAMRTPYTIIM